MNPERNVLLRAFCAEHHTSPNDGPRPGHQDYRAAIVAGLITAKAPMRLTDLGRERLGPMTVAGAAAEFHEASGRPPDGALEKFAIEAQVRALQFVRNLTPEGIDKVIADMRAGKVKL